MQLFHRQSQAIDTTYEVYASSVHVLSADGRPRRRWVGTPTASLFLVEYRYLCVAGLLTDGCRLASKMVACRELTRLSPVAPQAGCSETGRPEKRGMPVSASTSFLLVSRLTLYGPDQPCGTDITPASRVGSMVMMPSSAP